MPRRMAGGFRPQMRGNSPRRNPAQNPAQGFMAPPMMPGRSMAPEPMQPKMQASMPLPPPMPQIAQAPMVPQGRVGPNRLLPPMISQSPGLGQMASMTPPPPPPNMMNTMSSMAAPSLGPMTMKSTPFSSGDEQMNQGSIIPPQMSPIRDSLMTALNGGNFKAMNAEGPAPMLNRNQGGGEEDNYSQMRRGFGRLGLP